MSTVRAYEVLVIVDPRLTDEEVAQVSQRLQDSLTALGGEVETVENWGKRRLAFELRKQREGHYLLYGVKATPAVVRESERQLRLNESILRFLTTRVIARRPRPGAEAEAPPEPESSLAPAGPAPDEVG